jgi:antitoxin component of RelBE/YafQ-DinJ toxin-antitoxin module
MEGEVMSVDRPQGLIEGSVRRGEPRRLDQMVSARLDPTLVASLRQFASERGLTLSEALREAALLLLAREEAQNVITFDVTVTNQRSGATANRSFRQNVPAVV